MSRASGGAVDWPMIGGATISEAAAAAFTSKRTARRRQRFEVAGTEDDARRVSDMRGGRSISPRGKRMAKRSDQQRRNERERARYHADPRYRARALRRSKKQNEELRQARERLAELEAAETPRGVLTALLEMTR